MPASGDGGNLYRVSHCLILAHEDKVFDGATIASLSTPWGEAMGDDDLGGYHLVWTRDMCNSTTGLLAAGHTTPPLRALIYLACSQCPDGGFFQNFWITGEPYWRGIQLDEVSFPIMLAWRLHQVSGLDGFDPWPMVRNAAGYLIEHGPATMQERWEENGGYSPSTLASNIAGLICAACFASKEMRGRRFSWKSMPIFSNRTLTAGQSPRPASWCPESAALHPHQSRDAGRSFCRRGSQSRLDGTCAINLPTRRPDIRPRISLMRASWNWCAMESAPGSKLIEDSLRVVDAVLKVDTPYGPCWHRYNHDGYGQRLDGGPFEGWGHGHAWPLLTGERGHYELAAGRNPTPYIHAMEKFATATALLPEQVWDQPNHPSKMLYFGRETGAAMPLVWAHAEYIKLLRSTADGRVFDLVAPVGERSCRARRASRSRSGSSTANRAPSRPAAKVANLARTPFQLRWTTDEWQQTNDTDSTATTVGQHYADIEVGQDQRAPVRFTFHWTEAGRWEGRDYQVIVARDS